MQSPLCFGLFALFTAISASTVQHEFFNRGCVDLQCPALVFEHGAWEFLDVPSQISEDVLIQSSIVNIHVCMRMNNSRARRAVVEGVSQCSCMHSVPSKCQHQLSQDRNPDATMRSYTVCYHDSLQIPPAPEAINETTSVIATVEPFWHEPYWKDLELDNLTLHYDFPIKVLEFCEGDVVSSDYGEHLCKMTENMGPMNLNKNNDEKDTDYEQSDNYDQYDDQLPPEVEIPFEIFAGAEEVTIYYTITVNKYRQMQFEGKSVNISRNTTTQIESEVLKFKLKGLSVGANLPQTSTTDDEVISTEDDNDDVSEEYEPGSNFFDDGKVKSSEELMDKEDVEENHRTEMANRETSVKDDIVDQKESFEESKKVEQRIEENKENETPIEITTAKEVHLTRAKMRISNDGPYNIEEKLLLRL
uniref:C2 domain-containing protein n=1 Tax=Heterorhabditis bacteriophora TaxID=37862 RepID=A0A1I7XCR5_HETBA